MLKLPKAVENCAVSSLVTRLVLPSGVLVVTSVEAFPGTALP
jgi:hypothetical protein